ncbi:MAG: class I SAM-dependent methyltransferase [Nitrospiraceae bacterium]|nr:class I SAM-dependent methyltransferase [Nitrospiraceae bacterium]
MGRLDEVHAERHAVEATGITLSREQQRFARERFGLDSVLLCDYRKIDARYAGSFDRVVAVGVLEHVGYKNYRRFFRALRRVIKDEGIFVLQTIGGNVSVTRPDDWVDKYIFPNGMTPSIAQLGRAMDGLFVMEDWHNFGPSYTRTLDAWYQRSKAFFRGTDRYPPRFQRMWELYLVGSKVAVDIRSSQLWQLVLSPRGVPFGLPRVD